MRWLRTIMQRLAGLAGRVHRDDEIAQEIESNLQLHIDDNVRAGMTPDDARRHALVKMGGVEAVKDAWRDQRGIPAIEAFVQDLRFGLRMLARYPGVTIVVTTALALGIAANVVIFGLANALFLRPPAISDPERVVRIYGNRYSNTSYSRYLEYRDQARTLASLALFQGASLSLRVEGAPEHVFGMAVSGNYFEVLGVGAARGRTIAAADDRPAAAAPLVVLSDSAWRRRFGADPGVLGRAITINGGSYSVAGVAPAGFDRTFPPWIPELWIPWNGPGVGPAPGASSPDERQERAGHMIGRLRPDASISEARAELSTVAATLARSGTEGDRAATVSVYPVQTLGEVQTPVSVFTALLFALAGLTLLITCVNLATLLLARSTARTKEISVRLSLGASRHRLIRQLLTESLLLSGLGGMAAFALAALAMRMIEAVSLPTPVPIGLGLGLDWRVLGFAAGLSLATTVLFGLAPALRSSKTNVLSGLKEGASTAGPERSRLRAALVVAQVAMSAVLLIAGAVLIRSMLSSHAIDRGFVTEGVLTASIDLDTRSHTADSGSRFYEQLIERLEAVPGVRAASAVEFPPLTLSNATAIMLKEGQPPPHQGPNAVAPDPVYGNIVTRGLFRTLGIPLLAGRDFDASDRAGRPLVAIVNETLARRFWPNESPIGKRLRGWGGGDVLGPWIEVVGLARDSKYVTVGEDPKPFLYRPLAQAYVPSVTLLVKGADSSSLVSGVRACLGALDPELALFNVGTLQAATSISLLPVQAAAAFVGALGIVALLLVVIGIYGVVAHLVRQREREIGIRMALGAQPTAVVRQLTRQGVRWTLIGLALGVGASLLVTRLLASFLYGVSATDAVSFVAIPAILFGTAYAAVYAPARRATRVDPVAVLRE